MFVKQVCTYNRQGTRVVTLVVGPPCATTTRRRNPTNWDTPLNCNEKRLRLQSRAKRARSPAMQIISEFMQIGVYV